ncbi:MAG: hypothetical protein IJH64_12715 [Oscillospiraceae bacterium]|nr:hypothetical protein [Oscillospiraceae bacterium]
MNSKYCSMLEPAIDLLQETVKTVSRTNFFLWMYVAQEGEYDDALEFVTSKTDVITPFEELLRAQACAFQHQQWIQEELSAMDDDEDDGLEF